MSRLRLVDPNQPSPSQSLLEGVHRKLGRVPNMTRAMANSPAALEAYLAFGGALSDATLSARTRELIALAVGEVNDCEYCLAAHTAIGASLGLAGDALLEARAARSSEPKTDAVLKLARAIVLTRGAVTDADLRDARNAGVSDTEVADVVATVVLNVFTNWFNRLARTPVDFPRAAPLPAAPSAACGTSPSAPGNCAHC